MRFFAALKVTADQQIEPPARFCSRFALADFGAGAAIRKSGGRAAALYSGPGELKTEDAPRWEFAAGGARIALAIWDLGDAVLSARN